MDWKDSYHIGICFGTILMRANEEGLYPLSIGKILAKNKIYMANIGTEEDEEKFWMVGREFLTFYTDTKGFRSIFNSPLEHTIMDMLSDQDLFNLRKMSGSIVDTDYRGYKDISNNYLTCTKEGILKEQLFKSVREGLFYSLQDVTKALRKMGEQITIYRVHTEEVPYYLEQVSCIR